MSTTEFKDYKALEEEKRRGAPLPALSQEEIRQRSEQIIKMRDTQQTRDSSRKEFDGMDYVTRYETNLQADLSYIPPKLNKGDVRVVTGTTREKDNSLLAALLNYNFEASITAYDKENNEIDELGPHLCDLVRKSREIECYDDKRDVFYRELLVQGDVFALESLVTKFRIKRKADFDWSDGVDIAKFKADESIEEDCRRPEITLLSGTKVFLGNIRETDLRKQPYIIVVETEPYHCVRTQFAKWERWQYVPKKIARLQDLTDTSGYRDWTMLTTKDNYVEKIWFMDRPNNVLQLYLNGVPMLPCGFPLEEISPSGEYPLVQGSCEKTPFFAYSKGMAEKMKVDQAVLDEFMKLAVLKTQQSFRPTLANNTGSQLSPDIYEAGGVLDNLDPDKIKPVFTPTGITDSEMAFMSYMKEVLDSKSISATFTGEKINQRMTATQVLEMKKAALQKLGLVVWGVVQFEQKANWLRLQNILKHGLGNGYSDSILMTVKTVFENGKKGQRVYEFNKEKTNNTSSDQIRLESELLTARYGIDTRKVYLDMEGIRAARLKFRVTTTPTEKNTSELQQMMLANKIKDAITLFGPQSLNQEYWKKRWAMVNDIDPNQAFTQAPQMPTGEPGAMNGGKQLPSEQGTPSVGASIPKVAMGGGPAAIKVK